MSNTLFDKRSDFFRQYFEAALPYEGFLATGSEGHRTRWAEFHRLLQLSGHQRETLSSFNRTMYVLCLAGTWCGDCARQCPMLDAIASATTTMQLRFIDNKSQQALADELRINGGMRVPAVIAFSEDFFEVGRFGDRTLSTYRKKAKNELGPACDSGLAPPSNEELSVELQEWMDFFERLQLMLRVSPSLRQRHGD